MKFLSSYPVAFLAHFVASLAHPVASLAHLVDCLCEIKLLKHHGRKLESKVCVFSHGKYLYNYTGPSVMIRKNSLTMGVFFYDVVVSFIFPLDPIDTISFYSLTTQCITIFPTISYWNCKTNNIPFIGKYGRLSCEVWLKSGPVPCKLNRCHGHIHCIIHAMNIKLVG